MMTPDTNSLESLNLIPYASKTYQVNLETGRISGFIDGEDALRQAAIKILATDRFAYEIYNAEYGNELVYLVGKDYNYIISDIDRILNEAFASDDRFVGVENVEISQINSDSLNILFTVVAMDESRISMTKEVRYK